MTKHMKLVEQWMGSDLKGGGLVFQSYNISDLADSINRAKSL